MCVCVTPHSSHMKSKTQKQRWVYSTSPPVASGGLQPRFLAELNHSDANHNKKIILLVFQRSFRFILQAAVLMQSQVYLHKLDSQKLPNTGGLKKAVWKGKTALYREKLALRRENLSGLNCGSSSLLWLHAGVSHTCLHGCTHSELPAASTTNVFILTKRTYFQSPASKEAPHFYTSHIFF